MEISTKEVRVLCKRPVVYRIVTFKNYVVCDQCYDKYLDNMHMLKMTLPSYIKQELIKRSINIWRKDEQ